MFKGIKDSFENYKAFSQERLRAIPNTTANLYNNASH